jgi:hypothetical protein
MHVIRRHHKVLVHPAGMVGADMKRHGAIRQNRAAAQPLPHRRPNRPRAEIVIVIPESSEPHLPPVETDLSFHIASRLRQDPTMLRPDLVRKDRLLERQSGESRFECHLRRDGHIATLKLHGGFSIPQFKKIGADVYRAGHCIDLKSPLRKANRIPGYNGIIFKYRKLHTRILPRHWRQMHGRSPTIRVVSPRIFRIEHKPVMKSNDDAHPVNIIQRIKLPPFISARRADPMPMIRSRKRQGVKELQSSHRDISEPGNAASASARSSSLSKLTPFDPLHKVRRMSPLNYSLLHNLADDETGAGDIIFVCIFLLIVVLAAAYAVIWLRRRLWSQEDAEAPSTGFSLGDLKQLHRQGKITEQEFQTARAKVVATAQRQAAKQPPPKAR